MHTQLTVHTELLRFCYSLVPGLICGILLECFRTLRALLPHHPLAVFLEDTVFSFLCCFILQCYVWSFCEGALRWQYVFGMLTGLTLWLCTAGAVWMRMLQRLGAFRNRLTGKLRRCFTGLRGNADAAKKIQKSS